MKIKSILICMIVVNASMMVLSGSSNTLTAQSSLENDSPVNGNAPVPEDNEMDVLGGEFAVVGVRPEPGDDFDIEVYTDTSYSTLIDSSTTTGDPVDLVALEKDVWTSPPTRGVRITKGTTSYVMEMENQIDTYTTADTWTGSMDEFPGNPVLDVGPFGSWDDFHVFAPSVIYDGTTYKMWYDGNDGKTRRIGYATSHDGITWTKHQSNPVFDLGPSGSWDDSIVIHPSVLFNGGLYHMWYVGSNLGEIQIGYANSSDGITWNRYPDPVLSRGPSGSWEDIYVHSPTVLYDGTTFHVWYVGHDGLNARIGHATSSDGISWIKSPYNPVLDLGPSGAWDDVHVITPEVIFENGLYHMWYSGNDGSNYREGHAMSSDGHSWTKNTINPVLDLGPPGAWDMDFVGSSSVLSIDSELKKWYSGKQGSTYKIGYATYNSKWTKLTARTEVLDAYEITGINSGSSYSIDLEVPSTLDLDMFIYDTTGGRDDAVASSTNIGSGTDESITFTAPSSGDYLLVITNENGGTGEYTINQGSPPIADAGDDQKVNEGDVVQFNGSESFDPHGTIETYEWDFESDGIYDYQETSGFAPDGVFDGITTHTYGDNGIFIATLRVTDTQNLTDTDTCNITVINVDPSVTLETPSMDVEISLRLAGSKWSNAEMTLYEEDQAIGFLEVERWPGNPDDNPSFGDPVIPLSLDLTKNYSAVVTYDPYPDSGDGINGDQPNNGKDPQNNAGNPVWIVVKFPNGSEERAHHIFNTQQSKKRGSTHRNHADPWELNIMDLLQGYSFEISSLITDPGSDDISMVYTYSSQIITKEYLNNPPSLDPYPSPEVNPRDIMDITSIIYEGAGIFLLNVKDDDGGDTSASFELK